MNNQNNLTPELQDLRTLDDLSSEINSNKTAKFETNVKPKVNNETETNLQDPKLNNISINYNFCDVYNYYVCGYIKSSNCPKC